MERRRGRKRNRRRRDRRTQLRNRIAMVLGLVFVCVLLGSLFYYLSMRKYVNKQEEQSILAGVFIGESDVSGKNEKEARAEVEALLASYENTILKLLVSKGKEVEVSLKELGFQASNIEDAVKQAVNCGKTGSVVRRYRDIKNVEKNGKHILLTYSIDEQIAGNVLPERCNGFYEAPQDAALSHTGEALTIVKGKEGTTLDVKVSVKNINDFLKEWQGKAGTVKMKGKKTKPDIEAADLKEVQNLLGTYTTYYGEDGTGRSQNIVTGANHINGSLIMPGEEYSANAAMEPYTYENQYAEADSYESNTVVQTMGGGICQISTTLYNAVLFAELEITQRAPHSMLVNYVQPSMDAAIADDVLDLKFRNNLDAPVYLEAVLAEGNLTFNIYGKETRSPGQRVEFISETMEKEEPKGKQFIATDDAVGFYQTAREAHEGLTAQLWKVVYEDGVEVSRNVINNSQYLASPETVEVGTGSDNPEVSAKLNSAITSQDENTILAALQEISAGGTQE